MSEPEESGVVERSAVRRADDRLQNTIALLVALTATFMAVCNIKDGNVVQSMAIARSHEVNTWAHFQAKSTKQALTQGTLDQLEISLSLAETARPEVRSQIEARIADARAKLARYDTEKDELKAKAEGFAREYERLNATDDEFDVAEACLALSIALYGITALTLRRPLFWLSTVMGVWGIAQGMAGFLGVHLRPEWLVKLLN